MINCTFENGKKASLRHATVDALVLKDKKILLVKRSEKIIEGGKWGLIGGFVERDETLKEAITREVFEETGYQVKNLTLLTIRDMPDRPNEDRQNISFVFFCEAGKKTGKSDWEVSDQKWFNLKEIPAIEEMAFDHYDNIGLYLNFLKNHPPLPIL